MAAHGQDKLTPRSTLLIGLCAAALNFEGLFELAVSADYEKWLAWCYPICVDAYGLTAARVWLRGVHSAEVGRWAKLSSLGALMLSMGAGGLRAFTDLGHLPVWAKFIVSSLPALMLGLSVHLLVLVRVDADRQAEGDELIEVPAELVAPLDIEPAAEVSPVRMSKRRAARAYFDAEIGPADKRGATELGALLAKRFGVHEATGRQWVAAFRREPATPSAGVPAINGARRTA